jgi:hypothetical protein
MPAWPIPPDFPLADLVGQEVTQVCIGLGQVQIHFYKQSQLDAPNKWNAGARVEAESAFSLGKPGLVPHRVGQSVTSARREPGNELQLLFSEGWALVLHTDQQGFESYHLHVGGESVTVTRA